LAKARRELLFAVFNAAIKNKPIINQISSILSRILSRTGYTGDVTKSSFDENNYQEKGRKKLRRVRALHVYVERMNVYLNVHEHDILLISGANWYFEGEVVHVCVSPTVSMSEVAFRVSARLFVFLRTFPPLADFIMVIASSSEIIICVNT